MQFNLSILGVKSFKFSTLCLVRIFSPKNLIAAK